MRELESIDTTKKTGLRARLSRVNERLRAKQIAVAVALMGAAAPAAADPFEGFRDAMEDLAQGDFAIGVAILALLLGGVMALGTFKIMPALIGLALAAVFALGPDLVVAIFDWLG